MKLLVISDAHMLSREGKKVAYAPYVKELDLWMRHVDQTTIICPDKFDKPLLSQALAIQDFEHIGVRRLEFHHWKSAVRSIAALPSQILLLWREMKKADHIHLRAPGNLALLAGLMVISLSRKRKTVKYAGNWDPNAKQPISYKLQKKLFSSRWFAKNTTVMVYGEWRDQPTQIKTFFTASYSTQEIQKWNKELKLPLQFVFIGTLSANKNPQLLIDLVIQLNRQGIPSQAHFYGDGPLMEELKYKAGPLCHRELVSGSPATPNSAASSDSREGAIVEKEQESTSCTAENSITSIESSRFERESRRSVVENSSASINPISPIATFHGNQPADIVKTAYKNAHFVFLASKSEGWPKAVAEAMWHGCVSIATPVSCVPWMLNYQRDQTESLQPDKNRGILYRSMEETISNIRFLLSNPPAFQQISKNAQNWSQQYTLEGFEKAIQQLLQEKT